MKNFFWRHKFALIIVLILFIIPSFWFRHGEVDYGGDSTRLYFYDPDSWLKNIALYFVNPLSSLGRDMPNFFMIPFLLLLSFLKHTFLPSGYQLNNFFNGLLLSGGFFFVYLIAEEFKDSSKLSFRGNVSSVIAGLFFVLSPVGFFQWERALYGIGQFFVYPLIFLLFLKYLHTSKYTYIIFAGIASFVFSVNFSYATLPWFFAFFPLSFVFLFCYSRILGIKKLFIKGLILFAFLCFFLNSFDNFVQIFNFISPYGLSNRMLFSKEITANRALPYFLSIQPHVRLVYNLLNQDQYVLSRGFDSPFANEIYKYGIIVLPLFFIYPIIVCFAAIFIKRENSQLGQRTFYLLLTFFLISLFFVTANVTGLGITIYKVLFLLPWFAMFRSYVSKFSFVYVFYFSLVFSICLSVILNYLNPKTKKIFLLCLFGLIVFNGWSLLSGVMAKGNLWRSKNIPYASEIDSEYEKFISEIKKLPDEFKFFSFPIANEDYQILQGENGGVYFGPSSIPILTGKNAFSGQSGFNIFWPLIETSFDQKNYFVVDRMLPFLNIGYIFYNSSDYIYKNFSGYPYSDWFRLNYLTQNKVQGLIENLNTEKIVSVGDYNLYRLKEDNILPLIYSPEKIILSNDGIEVIPEEASLNGFNQKSAFLLQNSFSNQQKIDKEISDMGTEYIINGVNNDIENKETAVSVEGQIGAYPAARKLNFWKLILTLISEIINRFKLKFEGNYSVYEALTLLNGKVIDVTASKHYEKLLFWFYKNYLDEISKMIENEQDEKLKISLPIIAKNNLLDNLKRLKADRPKNYILWEKSINSTLLSLGKDFPFSISQRDFVLDVPKDGNYNVFIDEDNQNKTIALAESLNECQIEIADENDLEIMISPPNMFGPFSGKSVKLGRLNLSKGKVTAGLQICNLKNLLSPNEWEKTSAEDKLSGVTSVDGYVFSPSSFVYSRKINDWEPETWYRVEGKVVSNGKVIVSLGEKRKRWVDVHKKNQLLEKFDIVKTIIVDTDQGNSFSFDFKSSEKVLEAKIFVYKYIGTEETTQDAKIEELSVQTIFNPRLFLRYEKKEYDPNFRGNPQISFKKINPTKYLVNISNSQNPYILVFSNFFNPNWKITSGSASFAKVLSIMNRNTSIIPEERHFGVNGYANGWLILPSDFNQKDNYEFVIEFWPQRIFYFGIVISIITLAGCLIFLVVLFLKDSTFGSKRMKQ